MCQNTRTVDIVEINDGQFYNNAKLDKMKIILQFNLIVPFRCFQKTVKEITDERYI
jgi:hypothetical protein